MSKFQRHECSPSISRHSLFDILRFHPGHAGSRTPLSAQWAVLPFVVAASWSAIWFTPDQQGQRLLNQEEYTSAAESFRDPMRQGVAWFRAGEFEKAEQAFSRVATPEAEFNRGNCLMMRGKYDVAIERFDRALRLRPDWDDPRINRDIAVARSKMVEQKGGDMGDQKIGADEVVYDKDKESGGQDTETEEAQPLSNAALQAMWLRRVQTSPADFLKAKFAFQLASREQQGGGE